jgi:large subunit ribosomal protein L28
MSKVCEVCGKHPVAARSISHSHRVTNRIQRPNIQVVHVIDAKTGERRAAKVCTKCLKAGKIVRA